MHPAAPHPSWMTSGREGGGGGGRGGVVKGRDNVSNRECSRVGCSNVIDSIGLEPLKCTAYDNSNV